jgi:hypothetical protein
MAGADIASQRQFSWQALNDMQWQAAIHHVTARREDVVRFECSRQPRPVLRDVHSDDRRNFLAAKNLMT